MYYIIKKGLKYGLWHVIFTTCYIYPFLVRTEKEYQVFI